MKWIFVLRHAKSSWDDPSIDDHERPLAPRGRRAAALIAAYIRKNEVAPELVLCSTAQRARQTLESIRHALGKGASVRFESALYLVSAGELIDRVKRINDAISSVMLIGHNPGLADFLLELAAWGGPATNSYEVPDRRPCDVFVRGRLVRAWARWRSTRRLRRAQGSQVNA